MSALLHSSVVTLLSLASLPTALAQGIITDDVDNCDFQTGVFEADCIPSFIAHLIEQVFMFTGAVSLIMIMVGGYQLALGNIVGGKEKGQASVRWGIIGFIISALSFFIIEFIIGTIAAG